MPTNTIAISLPVAERRAAHAFYSQLLEREAVGPLADDGLPEPLQFELNAGTRLLLIPKGGFGWVIGDRDVAGPNASEVIVSFGAADAAGVDAVVERARGAGATIVSEAGEQPWGYAGTFADPDGHVWMVTAEAPGG